jgi:cellulose synthase/poly-beta-1,6-N-acetylglucosamine synthase-like glycosyltransferase
MREMIIELMQLYDFLVSLRFHFLMFHWMFFILLAYSLRRVWSRGYKASKTEEFKPEEVSIIVPVLNEEPKILEEVLKRAKLNSPKEILICVDGLTPEYLVVCSKYGKVIRGENNGKLGALAKSIKRTDEKSKFVAFLDSDTFLLNNTTLATTLTGFYLPEIVGVMGKHRITSPEGISGSLGEIDESSRNVVESGLARDNCLSVVDARFSVWRKDFLLKILGEFEGSKERVGEDAVLTYLAYKHGYKTYWVRESEISTAHQPTLIKYFKQQTRWARTGYYFYGKYMKLPISRKNKIHQTFYFIEPLSFLTSFILDFFVFYPVPWLPLISLPLFLALGVALNNILAQTILYNKPIGLKHILQLSLLGYFALFPIKIYSALTKGKHTTTMPSKLWLTRELAERERKESD